LLGLAIPHLVFELRAEELQIRFQEPDVAAHYAEMGNLLSLYPKIHRLAADTQEDRGVSDAEGEFLVSEIGLR
jgi:hypothetical protein